MTDKEKKSQLDFMLNRSHYDRVKPSSKMGSTKASFSTVLGKKSMDMSMILS